MSVTIEEIQNKDIWEAFLLSQPQTPFFQSWYWGEVQRAVGFVPYRLGAFENNRLVGIAQIIKIQARRGRYYHLRHGPIFTSWNWDWFDSLLGKIREMALEEKMSFIRLSPLLPDTTENLRTFKERGFKSSPIHNMDGEIAWVLDLDKTEAELLANMRKTTRYLIKRASKMGVAIEDRQDKIAVQTFLQLYEETAKRQNFVPHQGIWEEIKIFGQKDLLKLYLARFKNRVLAASLILFYGQQAVYHHSATSSLMPNLPASYLLQWEAIREAKRRSLKIYNFWGVAPPEKTNHPWNGLSLFKMGFGGKLVRRIHAQDLPLSPRYFAVFALETLFRIRKGY